MSLNLEKQLTFYGAYHHNPTNVLIHMTCVPLIMATSFFLCSNSPTLIPLPSWLTVPNLPLNVSTIGSIFYSGFYILLEPVAGSIILPFIIGWTAFSNHLLTTSSNATQANQIAGAIFVVSWILQFVGHGAFEKRAPALLDSLVQAIVLAPFFVFMEVLFIFGYRPELQKRIDVAVEKEIAKFTGDKSNGAAKNGKAN
ncbi:hypothetical protein SBOR_5876 [Sclerotinia borealis F-4128]|uniref:DUF962 domain-containing protein n=1 Tax=Sclerotinia borealis (strain F-4128) TaxID=1432307 RepID=W9CG60_SCLBF|nr:hypothetical protein SBOR_5876 [Sclerotinia borealis F-4128]